MNRLPLAKPTNTNEQSKRQSQIFPFSDVDQDDFISETIGYGTRATSFPLFHRTYSWNFVAHWIMKNERTSRKYIPARRLKLDSFLVLPVDLVYEILVHLHPIDLHHLHMTARVFRSLVMSRSSISLWKTVFSSDPDIPLPPPRFIEPRWASILFGPSICEECGRRGALMNFTNYVQLCSSCMESRYIRSYRSSSTILYDPHHPVWRFVPATYRTNGQSYYTKEDNDIYAQYFIEDVRETRELLDALNKDVKQGTTGALDELQSFEISALKRVEAVTEQSRKYHHWGVRIFNEVHNTIYPLKPLITDSIMQRLRRSGNDVHESNRYIVEDFVYNNFKYDKLTPRVWKKCRKQVEELIISAINRREAKARRQRIQSRGQVIKQCYLEFLSKQPPASWQDMPSLGRVLDFEPFTHLRDSSLEVLDVSECRSVMEQLPASVSTWRRKTRQELALEVIDLSGSSRRMTDEEQESCLTLATSVFRCPSCPPSGRNCFIGWDDASKHIHFSWLGNGRRLLSNKPGSMAASSLAAMLGFKPRTAKAADLDSADARFICASCPIHDNVRGHKAYTWRECVAHAIEMEHIQSHTVPSWRLIASEVAAFIKTREQPRLNVNDRSWSCVHCSWNFRNFVVKRDVVKHVRQCHSIARPVMESDYFYYHGPDAVHSPRRQVVLAEKPLADFKCAHCTIFPPRLFTLRDLLPHLRDKYFCF